MICNNKKQVFMGGSPKAKSTDFTPAFFLLQEWRQHYKCGREL